MNRLDQNLSRASHIAQIVLVCVAVFGYFFTVRPVYQKELLTEDLAKKQVELQSLREQITAAREELAVHIVRQFTFIAGAKCTGLLAPPAKSLKIGDPIPPSDPDLRRSFKSMTSCARSIFSEFEHFNKTADKVFNLTMQKPAFGDSTGLTDTITDLMVDALGAMVISLMGYRYLKRHPKQGLVQRWVRQFIHNNPRLFNNTHPRN